MIQPDPTWNAAVVGETLDGRTVFEAAIYGRFVMREWPSGMVGREQYDGVLVQQQKEGKSELVALKAAQPPKRAPKTKEKKP